MRKLYSLEDLEYKNYIQLGRGKVISKKDMKSFPGNFPVYSSAKLNNGKMGEYGKYNFNEELITWSVDGGGKLFYRNKHKFSITNVTGFLRIKDKSLINYRYLFYILSYLHSKISFDWVKKAHPSVLRKEYKDIPIVEIDKQKRIVEKLDTCMEQIDKAIKNVEQNIQNMEELFQSYLNEIFSQKGGDLKYKKIDEISKVVSGYNFKSEYFSSSNHLKSIKITNVGVQEFIQESSNLLPRNFSNKYKKVAVKSGDIVLALTRTIIADGLKVARVPLEYDGALLNQRVAAINCNKTDILPNYLYCYLSTDIVKEYVLSNVNTLMQPNLSIKDLKKMLVPIPPIDQQNKIISTLQSLKFNIKSTESNYRHELNVLNELKQSMLEKAFNGEL